MIHGYFQSIFLNMSACNLFSVPEWQIVIESLDPRWDPVPQFNTTWNALLPPIASVITQERDLLPRIQHPYWLLLNIVKPQDVPPYAIWRIGIHVCDYRETRVFLEVFIDDYHSSSIYGWNHLNSPDGVYITVIKVVNVLFESDNSAAHVKCRNIFSVSLRQHFIYDEQITKYIAGETPQQSHFSFYNQR